MINLLAIPLWEKAMVHPLAEECLMDRIKRLLMGALFCVGKEVASSPTSTNYLGMISMLFKKIASTLFSQSPSSTAKDCHLPSDLKVPLGP